MSARGVRRSRGAEEEESYFVSMADMMVGLVFVFVVLLTYFAMQFRTTTRQLVEGDDVRATILERLDRELARQGLRVTIDTATGTLRLPEEVLFDRGEAALSPAGDRAVALLGTALGRVLRCDAAPAPPGCGRTRQRIDAIFIEGHSDSDPLRARLGMRDNLDLSVMRATNTYRALVAATPTLAAMRSGAQPVLSVSGYGADRPIDLRADDAAKHRNRRIDLRFLMAPPPRVP